MRTLIRPTARRAVALVFCYATSAGAVALAQAPTTPLGKAHPAAKAVAPARSAESRPMWAELTADQQQALRPLSPSWNTMTEAHKRKWIALVANYRKLPPEEQSKLAGRMTEWAALSPQQRAQARLNFGEAKAVPADQRKAKWEAYQALSPEEKRKLAAGAAPRTPPTAAAVRPAPQKLANVPRPTPDAKAPRIVAGPVLESPAPQHPAATPPAPAPAPAAPQAN